MGFIVMVLTLAVLLGVLHHLTLSHHGPQLLSWVRDQYLEKKKSTTITIQGRHDPCIVLRATPVVKYTTWFVLADLFLMAGYKHNSPVSFASKQEE